MTVAAIIVAAVLCAAAVFCLLNLVNALQWGPRRPCGRTPGEILGKDPETASLDDLRRLSPRERMGLFLSLPAPAGGELAGEYRGTVLGGTVMSKSSEIFTHHVFPAGGFNTRTRWLGKAFAPGGGGCNLFELREEGAARVLRKRRVDTSIGPSLVGPGSGDSFHVTYAAHNRGAVRSMRDEIRKVNGVLYLGMGSMAMGGGPRNPASFALEGPPAPWIGTDAEN